jgi:hypothetical protein
MAVYVDDARLPFGRMLMCHMMADTREELDAMADKIGVARKWIQFPDTYREHYDIALSKRALAIQAGAQSVDGYFLVELRRRKQPAVTRATPTQEPPR